MLNGKGKGLTDPYVVQPNQEKHRRVSAGAAIDTENAKKTENSHKISLPNSSSGSSGQSDGNGNTDTTSTALKFMDVRRRIAEAANVGLSEAARTSHIGVGESVKSNTGIESGVLNDVINTDVDAFTLRRRQKLWHINNAVAATQFQHRNAAALPTRSQEQLLIDEVLHSLLGIGGTFIRPVLATDGSNSVYFVVSDQINCSLRDLCDRILPTGTHYTSVDDFCVQQCNKCHSMARQKGVPHTSPVLHALSCALRNLLQSFERTVVTLQADTAQLTLSKLQHMLRPSSRTMAVLAQIVQTIDRQQLSGAAVLNELHEQIVKSLGDEARQTVLELLLEQAAVPYIRTLELWTVKGVIVDPHEEFMIDEYRVRTAEPEEESYWNNRYPMMSERLPKFLANVAVVVQRTGKYLNVIRQCGHSIAGIAEPEQEDEQQQQELAQPINGSDGVKHNGVGGEILRFSATGEEHLVSLKLNNDR